MGEKAEIVEQLRLAEAWFDVDGDKTVPVDRNHGKWLFKTAADEIERLRAELDKYQEWHRSLLDCRIPLVKKLMDQEPERPTEAP